MQSRKSKNSKANRIETMKGPAESGQICSVGRRKIAKKIAKNKRCYANTLRPCSRMLLKVMKGGWGGHSPLGHLKRGGGSISALPVTGDPAKGDPGAEAPRPRPPTPPHFLGGSLFRVNGDSHSPPTPGG